MARLTDEAKAVLLTAAAEVAPGKVDGDPGEAAGSQDDKGAPVWEKAAPGGVKASNPADDATMDEINARFALQPLKAEDVFLGQMHLANTQYDRSDERFPKAYLDRFAETLPGKSVMTSHDYRGLPVGRFYDAEVRKDSASGGHYLLAKFYMAADHPTTRAVQMGIAKDASIGFMPDQRICDLDGKDYDGWYKGYGNRDAPDDEPCNHIKGEMYGGKKCTVTYGGDTKQVEAQEGSLVWLGCQRGAQTMRGAPAADAKKAAHFDTLDPKASGKGDAMEKELAAAMARLKELEAENDRLKPLAEDGTAYRKWLQQDILRLHKSLGEEATGKALVRVMESADATTLKEIHEEVDARHAKAFAKGEAESGRGAGDAAGRSMVRTPEEILFGVGARRGY